MTQKKLWFKSKTAAWGWTPASWEGWVVMSVFTILYLAQTIFFTMMIIRQTQHSPVNASEMVDLMLEFMTTSLFLLLILFYIIHLKGEKLPWPPKVEWPFKKGK